MREYLNLLLFTTFSCLLILAESSTCPINRLECQFKNWEVKSLLNAISKAPFPATISLLDTLKEHCDNATACFTCDKDGIQNESGCKTVASKIYDFETKCIVPTLKEIFEGGVVCAENSDFLSLDPATKQLVYFTSKAKDCFLDTMEKHCTGPEYKVFDDNYVKFMELYTSNTKHENAFYKFEKLQCKAMGAGFQARLERINLKDDTSNDVSKMLEKVKKCPTSLLFDVSGKNSPPYVEL